MENPELSILILLLLVFIVLLYSQYKSDKKEFSNKDYYSKFKSIKTYTILPIGIAFLLVVIVLSLIRNFNL